VVQRDGHRVSRWQELITAREFNRYQQDGLPITEPKLSQRDL